MKQFDSPDRSLGTLETDAVAKLIATAADVALILDRDGVVVDVAFHREEFGTEFSGSPAWIGRRWSDIVTPESRDKVGALLQEATGNAVPRWRHINHAAPGGGSVPILYTAVQVGDGRVVAVGRDLKAIASLQQRLVEAQQSMERDYSKLRLMEMRYRLLFQMSLEPFFIVDAATLRVIEINPAAVRVLGPNVKQLTGRSIFDVFDTGGAAAVRALLSVIRAAGRADDVRARLADGEQDFDVSASLFRNDEGELFLMRFSAAQAAAQVPKIRWKLLKLVESAPDGFVVTDSEGRILTANAAFLEIAQLSSADQAEGEMLERWLGQTAVDLNVLIANLRQRGSVRLFASTLRGEHGVATAVEISAVSVMNSERECFGFSIRNIGRRLRGDSPAPHLPRSVEQLTELVGRISLKDLVRETTDIIERLSIETALEMTGDNRASAAEMLGLSRQSLYVKLRRYGLAEFAADNRPGS